MQDINTFIKSIDLSAFKLGDIITVSSTHNEQLLAFKLKETIAGSMFKAVDDTTTVECLKRTVSNYSFKKI